MFDNSIAGYYAHIYPIVPVLLFSKSINTQDAFY